MTRRRISILLSVVSILFTATLFVFGVYASNSVNSTIENTFIYEILEDDFFVRITGSITGCVDEQNFTDFLEHNKDSEVTSYPNYYDVQFAEDGAKGYKDIVFTFKIANYNAFNIKAEIESETNSTNFTSIPSQAVTLDAYSRVGENYIADEDILTLTLKLNNYENFPPELNSFKIIFSKAE